MHETLAWTVEVVFSEDDDKTRADARLTGAPDEVRGWGRARRNPTDPDLPTIGEEVAAARALSDLAHHLLDQAAHRIESWAGRPVELPR
ncbi:MAG TPA: DUF1876 domain-containing protein [Acidimicrobiales bacterium]